MTDDIEVLKNGKDVNSENTNLKVVTEERQFFPGIKPAINPLAITMQRESQEIKISPPEDILDENLKRVGMVEDRNYIRQFPIGPYTTDFFVRPAIIVEVDGLCHYEPDTVDKDLRKVDYLESLGYRVLRISAGSVLRDPIGIAKYIKEERMRQIRNYIDNRIVI